MFHKYVTFNYFTISYWVYYYEGYIFNNMSKSKSLIIWFGCLEALWQMGNNFILFYLFFNFGLVGNLVWNFRLYSCRAIEKV